MQRSQRLAHGSRHGLRGVVGNAILTVDTEAQALARVQERGADAARVAVEMANVLEDLS